MKIIFTALNRVEVDGEEFIIDELLEVCEDALKLQLGWNSSEAIRHWDLAKIIKVRAALKRHVSRLG